MGHREAGGTGDSQGGGAGGRCVFREELDRMVLANQAVSFAFSSADGTMLSLLQGTPQTELIDAAEASAIGFLWRLELTAAGSGVASVTNRDAAVFTHEIARHHHEGSIILRLEWQSFRIGAVEVEGRVTASITLPATAPVAQFEAEIDLPDHLSVSSFAFPCLCAVGASDTFGGESLFLPISGGILIDSPRAALAGDDESRCWQAQYPGHAGVQLFGYSCGAQTTAWLAGLDSLGASKTLSASRLRGSEGLVLSITHFPSPQPGGHWSGGYPTAVGIARGEWFEAAREYRAWACRQPWCRRGRGGERRLPALTSSHGVWTSHWGGPREVVGVVHELQRFVNLPIKLDWRCWHGCARDGAYPDYFPVRGGDDVFAAAKRQLDDAGVLTQLNINGILASRKSEAWKQGDAARYALTATDAGCRRSSEALPCGLARMCPSTEYWRDSLACLAGQVVQHGADGIYVEDIAAFQAVGCKEPTHLHLHEGPIPVFWTAAVRGLLETIRAAIGGGRHLAVDGPAEVYLDLVDAYVTQHPAAERAGVITEDMGLRCAPIPLFSAIYHDYATLIGPAVALVNQRPHDPLWPRETIAETRLPAELLSGDYQDQFCLEIARATIWGHDPVLESFVPGQTRVGLNRHKMAFLAATVRASAWGVGALLPFAEFMGPLAIESATLDIELLVNGPRSVPSQRRSICRRVQPVIGTAWRAPGGSTALVLTNMDAQPQDFAARLRSGRLGVHLPLRMAGRVFSEDGDTPAPRLRAAGSEISGSLPGRSVLLMSLQ